jgi:hypothetical protein
MARTRVVLSPTPLNVFVALGIAGAVSYGSYKVTAIAMRFGVINTDAWKIAKAAVEGDTASLPLAYAIQNNEAVFYLKSGTKYHGVLSIVGSSGRGLGRR